jgi:hypothetical protein
MESLSGAEDADEITAPIFSMKSILNSNNQNRKLSWPWQHLICLYSKFCRVSPMAAVKEAIDGSVMKQQLKNPKRNSIRLYDGNGHRRA